MSLRKPNPYLFTIVCVALMTVFKWWLNRWTGVQSPLLLYYSVIILSAWFGGPIQGLLAGTLSLIAAHFIFIASANPWTIAPGYNLRYLLFFIDCVLVTLICSALQRARARAESSLREAKMAQAALQENELRFRRVFESNMIGLLFTRRDGSIVDCNDYVLDMLNYTRDDLNEGRLNWRKITPPEFLERSDEALRELSLGEQIAPFEKTYLRSDGTKVPVLIGPARLNSEQIVTFVLDISERKNAERAISESYMQLEERVQVRTKELRETADRLQQSQAFLDSVIENLPNMVFVKDAKDLRFVRFNRAGENLLGYTRSDLLGKNDYDFFPTEEAEAFQAKDRAVLNGKVVVDIAEEPLSTKFGLRYLHTKKIPILGPDYQPQYLLGISEDITDRKASEQQRLRLVQEQAARAEAEKTADQLRFLSDASATLNETLDLHAMLENFAGSVISYMADWCEIVLVQPEEFRSEEIVIAHGNSELRKLVLEMRQNQSGDWRTEDGVGRVIRSGRPELHTLITPETIHAAVKNPAQRDLLLKIGLHSSVVVPLQSFGRTIGALAMSSSTSGRSYNALDLSLAMDLAKRVSFAVENSRLFQKSQEASRAKSAFLANMSHEIRTPLGAMLGFAELLSDDGLSEEQQKYLATLTRNGRQLLRIVDEILDISKVESERIEIESIEFALPSLIDEVISLLRLQAEDKGLQLLLRTVGDIPKKIVTDPTRLRQILINVVGNAIKFTPHGKVEVEIEIQEPAVLGAKGVLQIRVRDTGVGISPEQRGKLFQPFVQADNSMTRRFGGTGLGLFLSRRLARLMGGDVELGASELGQGSEFIVTVGIEIHDVFAQPKRDAVPPRREIQDARPGRVLIVDDAPDNRMLIQLYVQRLGYAAETAATGQEGVTLALENDFDVILMDVQMPEMDGFAAVKVLRAREYHGPIVALTAHTMKGDRERCLEGGFDDYLGKPVDREALRASLLRHIQKTSLTTHPQLEHHRPPEPLPQG